MSTRCNYSDCIFKCGVCVPTIEGVSCFRGSKKCNICILNCKSVYATFVQITTIRMIRYGVINRSPLCIKRNGCVACRKKILYACVIRILYSASISLRIPTQESVSGLVECICSKICRCIIGVLLI